LGQQGPINWGINKIAAGVMRLPELHLFTTLGRTKGLYRGWMYYSSKMMPFGSLDRIDCEMVIIRVATLRDCQYELDHHKRLGKRAGIDADLLAAITAGPDADGLDDRRRAILKAVDELVHTKDITDETWRALAAHLQERQLIELVLLVGQYDSLATTIGTLRIERDV
jgi:AhpD family alkylhydroperoxidase